MYSSAAVRAFVLILRIAATARHFFLLITPPFDALMMSCSSKNHPMGILWGGGALFSPSTWPRINAHAWSSCFSGALAERWLLRKDCRKPLGLAMMVLAYQLAFCSYQREFQTTYRICSIRRRGYYLFHHAILRGFYSRAATNRERRLLNSVLSVKSQFYKINKEYTMRWLGSVEANLPASWSAAALLQSDTYTAPPICFFVFASSNDFIRWSLSVPQPMPNFSGQLSTTVPIVYTIWYCDSIESLGLFTCARLLEY